MILAAACLDPELEWAWTKLGLNFEQKEDGDSSESTDSCAVYGEKRKQVDRQLWWSALSHNAKLRSMADEWEDVEWLEMKAAHSKNHDYRVLWECAHLPRTLCFRLITLVLGSTVYQLQLLPSLLTHPHQASQRERETEFYQFLNQESVEHISLPCVQQPHVPVYASSELERWTSHLDPASRNRIHQTRLLLEAHIAQMKPSWVRSCGALSNNTSNGVHPRTSTTVSLRLAFRTRLSKT
eukprot:2190228-Rhodomonas_salina.2